MAKILGYTSPARGHLFPMVAILEQLHLRGHQISLRTLDSETRSFTAAGFEASPIDPEIEAILPVDYKARSPQKALLSSVATFVERAPLDARDLSRAIEAEDPDFVLVDTNAWGAVAAAERWGGPWAMMCPFPIPLSGDGIPPYGPGFKPAIGPFGRMRDGLLRPMVLGTVKKAMVPPLNRIRHDVGLTPLDDIDDLYLRPPLVLYLTAEGFEYARGDWPSTIQMVGPCVWERPTKTPEWLEATDRPVVLVTTSSEFQNDGRLVQIALDALANEPFEVVATVPAGLPSDYRIPANAHVEQFLAHSPVLAKAACAITHGGMGVTQKALSFGVPVCAVPFGRDQLEVARRVAVSGSGSKLNSKKLAVERLRKKVRDAVDCRAGAEVVAELFRVAGGPSRAADLIESALATTRP
ncbi:MAG: glycosyltransferase [Actinomycetota bacterium]